MNLQVQVEHGTVDKTDNIIWWPTLPVGIFILSFHSCAVVHTWDLEQFIQLETFPNLYPPILLSRNFAPCSEAIWCWNSPYYASVFAIVVQLAIKKCPSIGYSCISWNISLGFVKCILLVVLSSRRMDIPPSTAQQAKCKLSSPRWAWTRFSDKNSDNLSIS